jgi:4-hydroxybutyrate CoA-transferase
MIAGVKFCGGCNPKYDRKLFYDILKNEYKNIIYQTVNSNSNSFEYDLIIVFCGCSVCCADYKKYKTKTKYIVIKSIEEIHKIKNEINEIYNIQEKS